MASSAIDLILEKNLGPMKKSTKPKYRADSQKVGVMAKMAQNIKMRANSPKVGVKVTKHQGNGVKSKTKVAVSYPYLFNNLFLKLGISSNSAL